MASSKREKELARQRAERQAARRAASAQRRKQRTAVIASVAAVVLVVLAATAIGVAVTNGDEADEGAAPAASSAPEPSLAPSVEPSTDGSAIPSPTSSPGATPVGTGASCEYVPGGTASKPAATPPAEDVEDELVLDVRIATNRGEVVFEMDTAQAPCTASSLRTLASVGYFDDTPCHRLTTQGISVLQCGDPTGTGTGGPGYTFANENLEGATYPRGTVAMANGGPDTNGSQFFLVYADSTLPNDYTPFGQITEGLDVLDAIAAAGSDNTSGAGDGAPNLPVQIERLRVTAREA